MKEEVNFKSLKALADQYSSKILEPIFKKLRERAASGHYDYSVDMKGYSLDQHRLILDTLKDRGFTCLRPAGTHIEVSWR